MSQASCATVTLAMDRPTDLMMSEKYIVKNPVIRYNKNQREGKAYREYFFYWYNG